MERRKFNGNWYYLLDRYTLKRGAQADAQQARAQGKSARVVLSPREGAIGNWAVYVR